MAKEPRPPRESRLVEFASKAEPVKPTYDAFVMDWCRKEAMHYLQAIGYRNGMWDLDIPLDATADKDQQIRQRLLTAIQLMFLLQEVQIKRAYNEQYPE